MKPSRKPKVLHPSRICQPEPPAETRSPATEAAANTLVYIGITKGPKPTKYFVTVYFNLREKAA